MWRDASAIPLVGLLFVGRLAWAQNSSLLDNGNGTNTSNITNCYLGCCRQDIKYEAEYACRELENWGGDAVRCSLWMAAVEKECERSCADCAAIAKVIYDQCFFLLMISINFDAAKTYCEKLRDDFEQARCPTTCIDKNKVCFSDGAHECGVLCGNFNANCHCFRQRHQFGYPDTCEGETVLTGPVPDRVGLQWSCALTPHLCKNHWAGTQCGMYKHCPINLCVVKNITCSRTNTCQNPGVCAPGDGQCYFTLKPDGASCDDGFHYTHSDKCAGGECYGLEDKCARYNISCSSLNPCLVATSKVHAGCDPTTGNCVFTQQPDGTPCPSNPGGFTNGLCQAGLCRRNHSVLHPCWNKTCQAFGECHETATCHLETGQCHAAPKPDGMPCSDDDPSTHRDTCIEGRCVGDPIADPHFRKSDRAVCNMDGDQAVARYYSDTPDAGVCEKQCREDPECTGYSYGYHVCSIFGTSRTHHPDATFWGRQWILDATRVSVDHDFACFVKHGDGPADPEAEKKRILLIVAIVLLVLVPIAYLMLVHRNFLLESLLNMQDGPANSVSPAAHMPGQPLSPKGGAAAVGPAPVIAKKEQAALDVRAGEDAETVLDDGTATSPAASSARDPRGEVDDGAEPPVAGSS